VVLPTATGDKTALIRYGGFAGYEIGGSIDYFDTSTEKWESIELEGEEGLDGYPPARSVHALLPIRPQPTETQEGQVVGIMLFGERGPAPAHLGHLGAGAFHSDAWALVANARGQGMLSFQEIKREGEGPEARGWFAAHAYGQDKFVVNGGLREGNERLADTWFGEVNVE
jgi:hypothetical protein